MQYMFTFIGVRRSINHQRRNPSGCVKMLLAVTPRNWSLMDTNFALIFQAPQSTGLLFVLMHAVIKCLLSTLWGLDTRPQ